MPHHIVNFASNFWPSDWLSKVSDLCSVGSLMLTYWLTKKASEVRRELRVKFLTPMYTKQLDENCVQLTKLLLKYDVNSVKIGQVVVNILADIKSLAKYTNPHLSDANRLAIAAALKYQESPSEENARSYLNATYLFLAYLKNELKEISTI